MKRILFALTVFLLTSINLYAQKGSVTGILLDSANHKLTLNYATVSLYKGADTVITDYKLSNDKGVFKLTGLEVNVKYRIVINAWMYNVLRKEISITPNQANLDLGNIYLSEKTNTLQEVVIKDIPPVIVRKDTIEFNAESFKTLPTAVVEDLLKKLPGVAIAEDGSIQVNGKTVSKILVDGKEFFGGDQQIATKNLPANVIDKIQVTDDKEAKRRDPDILAANTPQVINLKLKRAIKKGAFGKLYAGGGLDERFEAGGIMNFFRDTTQVSLLAYGNNVNKPGFSINDVSRIGGMQRTGINSVMMQADGRFELNGVSFGGSSSGIQQSAGAGANFNTLTKKGDKLNLKYFFGQGDQRLNMLIDNNQNLDAGNIFTHSDQNQRNKTYTHNISGKAELKLDSLTTLTFEPAVSINNQRNNSLILSDARNNSNQLLNNGSNESKTTINNIDYSLVGNLWKDFKKAGRSFNSSINLNKRDNLNDNFNNTVTNFYNPNSTILLDQLRDNNIRNKGGYLSVNYTEPFNKKLSLVLATNGNYIDNENALATFLKDPNNQAYDIVVPDQSQTVNQQGFKTNTRASLKWKATNSLTIQPGFVFNTIDLKNTFTSYPSFNQNFEFIAPSLNIRYKSLSINYSPTFREPDVNYIQPVANNSNPLFIQNGNPNLVPTKNHQVYLNLYKYDTKNTLNYNANANASIDYDGVIMSRIIATNGVQTTTPINVNGIFRFNGGFNITKDFKKPNRQFSLTTGFWSNYTRNIVQVNNVRSYAKILGITPRINGRMNLNDKIELSLSYYLGINRSSYDDPFFNDISYLTHSSDNELVIRLPKQFVWETTYRISYNTQTVAGFNNNIQIWNASLTYLFLKNNRAQLKFAVNDILNTNTRRTISINENSIRDVRYNNLGRHGLVTLTYNIQNFGGKVGGRESMFRF